ENIFSEEFLLTRPLLEAIRADEPVVLLIDEVDRVEVETEALLLEILSDYQVSIPELGTVDSLQIPLVFLTSNNTRQLSEAPRRPKSARSSRRLRDGTARMLDLLAGFIQELRAAGLPVSLTENLDAMEAVRHIPLEDREAFKYALAATLVKSQGHWRAFETVF